MSENDLVGTWQLVSYEGSIEDGKEGTTLIISKDGTLAHILHQPGKDQIINLMWRVSGDYLITDQPSRPKEECTKFSFDGAGRLVLEYKDSKSIFARR